MWKFTFIAFLTSFNVLLYMLIANIFTNTKELSIIAILYLTIGCIMFLGNFYFILKLIISTIYNKLYKQF